MENWATSNKLEDLYIDVNKIESFTSEFKKYYQQNWYISINDVYALAKKCNLNIMEIDKLLSMKSLPHDWVINDVKNLYQNHN